MNAACVAMLVATLVCAAPEIAVTVVPTGPATEAPERIGKPIAIPLTRTPPTLDGRLDDACWAQAAVADGFVRLGGDSPAREQTVARLTADAKALYVAFLCRESRMDKVLASTTRRDGPVWEDDCVEIFVDANHDHLSYRQFVVNLAGAQFDARKDGDKLDIAWNAAWEASTARQTDGWTAEVAIPFAALGGRPKAFGLNLAREQQPGKELSSWAPQHKGFAYRPEELARFGDATFGRPTLHVASLRLDAPGWGRNRARARVVNRSAAPAECDVTMAVTAAGRPQREAVLKRVRLAGGAAAWVELDYDIPQFTPGGGSVEVAMRDRTAGATRVIGRFPYESADPSPLAVTGRVLVGPECVLHAALRPVVGELSLREAVCRVRVTGGDGRARASRVVPVGGRMGGCRSADLQVDLSSVAHGRYTVSLQLVGRDGQPLGPGVDREVDKLAGPFEPTSGPLANRVTNPSFEATDKAGEPVGWSGYWWAPKHSGLSRVPVRDFLGLDKETSSHGRHSIRIRSTRAGKAATSEVLTVRTTQRIVVKPGTPYLLTCRWRSQGIAGIGKIWAQTPKRQFVFKGAISGTKADWAFHQAAFTPGDGETWCVLNFSLHGRDGVLWVDDITFTEQQACIRRLLAPNAFKPDGVCLVDGDLTNADLRLAVTAVDPSDDRLLASVVAPVHDRQTRFRLPTVIATRSCRLIARLLAPGGRIVDAASATVFGARAAP